MEADALEGWLDIFVLFMMKEIYVMSRGRCVLGEFSLRTEGGGEKEGKYAAALGSCKKSFHLPAASFALQIGVVFSPA